MNEVSVKCPWIEEEVVLSSNKKVQISLVAYEHRDGIPARFCAGLVPAVALSKHLATSGVASIVRLIDPTPIANYCNGWQEKETRFRDVISDFMGGHSIDFFFDQSEKVLATTVEFLGQIGSELESSSDVEIIDMVSRIKESGMRHGGESGAKNSVLYMAAHPFSWLDMHHSLVWNRKYDPDEFQFINLMSKPESRFSVIRNFLRERRPDLSSGVNGVDHYMTVCNTPCYIPLEGEPTLVDLEALGREDCLERYKLLKKRSNNHRRAFKDFEVLLSFDR